MAIHDLCQSGVDRLRHVPVGGRTLEHRIVSYSPAFTRFQPGRAGVLAPQSRLVLPVQRIGHPGVDMPHRLFPGRLFPAFDLRQGLVHLARLVRHLLVDVVRPQVQAVQVPAHAIERVTGAPGLHLALVPVQARVVGGGVGTEPVRHGLDEGWSLSPPSPIDRLPGGRVDGKHVHSVDLDAGHAVADRLVGQIGGGGLAPGRHRDRPAVIGAQEHGRRLPNPGEVHGGVEVALGGGPVAEVDHGYQVLPGQAGGVGMAHGVGQLGGDRDGVDVHAVPVHIPVAVGKPPVVGQHHRPRHPPDQLGRMLPVAGVDPVVGFERVGRTDLSGLLSLAGREGSETALALQPHGPPIEAPPQRHEPVHLHEVLAVQIGRLADQLPRRVQDLQHRAFPSACWRHCKERGPSARHPPILRPAPKHLTSVYDHRDARMVSRRARYGTLARPHMRH